MADYNFLSVIAAALLIDAIVGDPAAVWRRIPHPVVMMGWLVGALDRWTNLDSWPFAARRAAGGVAVAVIAAASGAVGIAIHEICAGTSAGWAVESLLAAILLAQKSLYDHFRAIEIPLAAGDVEAARAAAAMIVGRDTHALDAHGIARAGIESLAESTCDGIVAPAFWGLLFGLPGLLVYKAVNTADSMIGHRTPRHEAFGWATAKMDTLLNLIPAYLTGLLYVLGGMVLPGVRAGRFFLRVLVENFKSQFTLRTAGLIPEEAMAQLLDLKLRGPRDYGGVPSDNTWLGTGRAEATPDDMARARRLYVATCGVHFALFAGIWLWWLIVNHLLPPL